MFLSEIVRGIENETMAFESLSSFDYRPSDQDFLVVPRPLGGRIAVHAAGVAAPRPGPARIEQAAYYPSAPPPTVQPKGPRPSAAPLPALPMQGPPVPLERPIKSRSDYEEELALMEGMLARDPRHVPTLQALSDAAQMQRDIDTAALASAVLVCLQSARPEDEVRLALLVTDALPLAGRTLVDKDFDDALLANREDRALLEVLGRLTKASLAGGLAFDAGFDEHPKEAAILDPESSTVTLGRSLAWACKFLGVDVPELVVHPELPTHMLLTLNGRERLLISKQLGSGLSLAQLAFLGARHLSMLRPEFKWRAALDSPQRLGAVIDYCARFCREGPEFTRNLEDSERKGAKRFWAQVETEPTLVEQVGHLFTSVDLDRPGCEDLARQILAMADRVLIRSGLLACANPAAAWQLSQQYPLQSLVPVEEQLDEIAQFATSRRHMMLRRSIGLTCSPLPKSFPAGEGI